MAFILHSPLESRLHSVPQYVCTELHVCTTMRRGFHGNIKTYIRIKLPRTNLSFFRETLFHPIFFIVNSRDIDNPLNPWVQVYKGELKLEEGAHFHDRPALDIVIRKFRTAKLTAYAAGLFFTVSKRFGTV